MLDKAKELISHFNPKSPAAEAYRVLRTNIQYSSIDKPLKSLVFTSSGSGEGKSTTVTNIAIVFAQTGYKVLIVDGDLRKPRIHKIFNISSLRGLSNYLVEKGEAEDYILSTEVPNLFVLPCGTIPPNPSELLASNAMKQFVKDICTKYDIVFIDAPPIGAVTDAAVLSTICDGAVIVAASGIVDDYALLRTKEILQNLKANIIGVVLNRIKKSSSASYHYYYYYYDSSNDGNTKGKRKKRKSDSFHLQMETEI